MMENEHEISIRNVADGTASLLPEGCTFSASKKLKVAVIGAGPSGLNAARHIFAEESGMTGCVFEQTSNIGGTWFYNEAVGKDKYGIPIHSCLYHNLWTNLPQESMGFPDFPYPEKLQRSYLSASEVIQYLENYADYFNLHPHIKLNHQVKCVAPYGKHWSVVALDLVNDVEHVSVYDAVLICSGTHGVPVYPKIEGLARFSGKQLHSKEFRRAETYKDKRILIVGIGPSGMDLTYNLLPHAKNIILSHNLRSHFSGASIPKQVKVKPEVVSLEDKAVTFKDGSTEDVDVIIYCTGYTYHYPYLTNDCGLVNDEFVTPLYMHMINIEHPTMCIIGLPGLSLAGYLIDYQVQTCLKIIKGEIQLPSKEEMLKELEDELESRKGEGQRKKDFHKMGINRLAPYLKKLTEIGKLKPIPKVKIDIFFNAFTRAIKDFGSFRNYYYTIIDDENYKVEKIDLPNLEEKMVTFKLDDDNKIITKAEINQEADLNENNKDELSKEVNENGNIVNIVKKDCLKKDAE